MAYKSLFTVFSDPAGATPQLDEIIDLARREDAHLEILCLGVDRTQTGYYYAGATAMIHQETYDQALNEARACEKRLADKLANADIRWSTEAAVAQLGGLSGLVSLRARFADLVVQAKPYGPGGTVETEAIIEAAMFEGKAPVLVLPESGLGKDFARRIVLAWNQGEEGLRAARAALPLLRRADLVNIVVIDPPSHGAERSDPGGPLSQMLARHGVKTEVSVLAKTMPRVSDVLCRHVRDEAADLVVMGAYGHSRFRQAILGGTTRNMLEMAEVPVFMAH